MIKTTTSKSRRQHSDHRDRKVHCPQCRARLMDIQDDSLLYTATVLSKNCNAHYALTVKCQKCRAFVGLSFEHRSTPIPLLGPVSA